MKVKLTETVQGAGISGVQLDGGLIVKVLEPGKSYEVDDTLGAWLVDNHKAEEVTVKTVHYGAQSEPEFRHDDQKYKVMTAEPEPEEPPAEPEPEDEPIMTTKKAPKRGKRTK